MTHILIFLGIQLLFSSKIYYFLIIVKMFLFNMHLSCNITPRLQFKYK